MTGAVGIDAAGFRFLNAEGTEAGDLVGVDVATFLLRTESVGEGALTFGTPHDAVDVVGAGPVFDNAEKKISIVGIVEADGVGVVAGEIDFLHGGDVGDVGAEGILEPADSFDVAFAGGGGDVGEDVVAAELGGASAVEDGVLVVLGMDGGVISAGEGAGVVLLLAVVGEGLAGDLATGDAATVGKGGEEESVDVGILLEVVENFFCSFIDEGDGADLDAYGFFIGEGGTGWRVDDGGSAGRSAGRTGILWAGCEVREFAGAVDWGAAAVLAARAYSAEAVSGREAVRAAAAAV